MKQFIKKDEGYTLLEVLMAMALFLILIIPFYQFILYVTSDPRTIDALNALNLAETEMEKAIIHRTFKTKDYIIESNGKHYKICLESINQGDLIFLRVSVYSQRNSRKLVNFKTCCLERGNSP
jgi:prepilin-type N-terminal cleavage/methylation domain-containing protein